jgi:tetratricopeptide (TPR) repeat protein
MTANHQLLYHLAELMLAEQQHQLPVDRLFDDERIGEFVKSIQIDSPYQQMVLEGVLTETFKEDKMYVAFTVEGYFHFVLGEVIFNQATGKGAEFLKEIIENNTLNGTQGGVEQCLIRDVEQDNLSRLISLIDQGGTSLEVCSVPLAHAFMQVKGNPKTKEEMGKAQQTQIKLVMDELLTEPTDYDIDTLNKSIAILESTQLNLIVSSVFQMIFKYINPYSIDSAMLYVKSIRYAPAQNRKEYLKKISELKFDLDTEKYISYLLALGSEYQNIADYDKAIECYEKSLFIIRDILELSHPATAVFFNNLGLAWKEKGEYDKALENLQKSLFIRLKENGESHDTVCASYANLGSYWMEQGNYDKAKDCFDKSLAIDLKIHGAFHPSTAISYSNLGVSFKYKGDYKKAIDYTQKALAVQLEVNGESNSLIATYYGNIAGSFIEMGEFDEAIVNCEKALSVDLKIHGELHPSILTWYNNLGVVWQKKGDNLKAIDYYEDALRTSLKIYGDCHPKIISTYNNLGSTLLDIGEIEKALLFYDKSLKLALKVYGNSHQKTGWIYNYLGNCFLDKNEPLFAKRYFQKAYDIFFKTLGESDKNTIGIKAILEILK